MPTLLETLGLEDHGVAILLGSVVAAAKMCGVMLCTVLIDRIGRRPLLIYGSLVMAGVCRENTARWGFNGGCCRGDADSVCGVRHQVYRNGMLWRCGLHVWILV